ncbi:stress response protein NST1 isoform X2 [Carica papaya]|nr:stress response protein NST1 isoform X2 [Carica papaya]
MEEIRPSPSPPTATSASGASTDPKTENETTSSVMSRVKKGCLSLSVSLQEGFRDFKAFFIGQAKKLTARNEKEATEADLATAKMEVEAADDAENMKKRIEDR